MNVERCNAVIIVFAMRGCPACEDYKPRLERELARWRTAGAPFVDAVEGQTYAAPQIPVVFLDANSPDPQIQALADQNAVHGLPSTVLYRRGFMGLRPEPKIEGSIDDAQIYALLAEAVKP